MNEGIKQIYDFLNAGRVKEALVQLEGISESCNDWELRNQIREQQTAYNYLLQYAGQNAEDPNRKHIYRQIHQKALELTAWTKISLNIPYSSDPFYNQIRTFQKSAPRSYMELLLLLEAYTEDMGTLDLLFSEEKRHDQRKKICQQHEEALNELFNKTWVHFHWSEVEAEEAWKIIESLLVTSNDKAVLISAVTLNLMHIWDKRKVQFLINACRNEDLQVSQRALVGLFFVLIIYESYLDHYPEIAINLSLLTEQNKFRNDLVELQSQILMTLETDKIIQQMNTEIIPNLIKNPKLKKGNIFLNTEEGVDINPEWEAMMEKTGINDSIWKITEFQMEGGDIHMGTFCHLKDFPFFKQTSHWFYPLDFNHPEFLAISEKISKDQLKFMEIILRSETFCNSDKYSFYLSFVQMPSIAKEMNLKANMQMVEDEKEMMMDIMNPDLSATIIRRHYIQDLYRFYHIYVKKYYTEEDMGEDEYDKYDKEDNLQRKICIWNNKWCKDIFSNEIKKNIADTLLQRKSYKISSELYRNILNDEGESIEILQKIGYTLQKREIIYGAIEYYKRADLLLTDHIWTLKHLAQCYKSRNDYRKALNIYKQIDRLSPDDLNIAQQISECLIMLEQYEEAIPLLYKVLYWKEDSGNAQRAIAWCLFHTRKYEESLKYYNQIFESGNPIREDWLNAGHVYLVQKDIPMAVTYYKKAKEMCKNHDEFIQLYESDLIILDERIDKEDIMIVLDLLV